MLSYIKYNDEKFAVLGDKKLYHSEINKIGGRWNSRMKGGPGWLVPVTNESDLKKLIRKLKKEHKLKIESENLPNKNDEDLPEQKVTTESENSIKNEEDLPEIKEEDLLQQVLEMVKDENENLQNNTAEEIDIKSEDTDENEVLEKSDSPSSEIDNTIIENNCETEIKNSLESKQNSDNESEDSKNLIDLLNEEKYHSDSDKSSECNYDEIFADFNTEIGCNNSEAETSPDNSDNEMTSPDNSDNEMTSPDIKESEILSPDNSETEIPNPDNSELESPTSDIKQTEIPSPDNIESEMVSHDTETKELYTNNESDDDTIVNNIKDAETVIQFADIDSDDDSAVVENFLDNLLGDLSDEDERTRKLKKSKERFRRITKSRDADKKKRQEKIKFKKQVIEAENARKNTSDDTSSFEFYKNLAFRSNENGVTISDTSDSEYSDESDDYPSASTVKKKSKAEEIVDLETEIAQLRLENSKLSTQLKNIIQNY
jgi:hypothetical protein